MICAITKVFINRLDTGEAVSAQSGRDRGQKFANATRVDRYANGRMRAISTPGEAGELKYALMTVSLATKDKLRTWARDAIGVQVRDHRGQKWFGVFADVDVDEELDPSWYNVTITVQTVTYVEGV